MEALNSIIRQSSSFLQAHWLILLISFISFQAYYYYETKYKYWSKRNLKGPLNLSFIGDLMIVFFKNRLKVERERVMKYGKVYGASIRGSEWVVVADAEVIRQICIKDFDAFPNHNVPHWCNQYQRFFLVWLRDEHWKRVRTLMSPTFTSGKIKRMFKFLDGCAEDLLANIGEQQKLGKTVINLRDLYCMFTMDGISTCCYGLKLQRDKSASGNSNKPFTRDDFIRHSNIIFKPIPFNIIMALTLPKFFLRLINFKMQPENLYEPLIKRVQELINKRQDPASSRKYDDLLQLLVDAKLGDEIELNALDEAENHHAGLTKATLINDQKKLTEDARKLMVNEGKGVQMSNIEVLSEAIFLLAAGMDTTKSLLTNVTYALAFHPDIQQQLYEELSKIAEHDLDTNCIKFYYDALTTCQYLDAVISESLRSCPPAVQVDREATRDYLIKKYNLNIPKGGRLMMAIYAVQNDPDYWEEPEKFKPERFLPGNREKIIPGSYIPFSMGPRHCLGMRFSLTEAKLGLAKVLMQYKLEPAPDTSYPPEPAATIGLMELKRPLVRFIARR